MLKIGLAAVALLFATSASAQQDNLEFRVLGSHDGGVAMVSTVTGPQTERRLTEVIILKQPGEGGTQGFSADFKVNCSKGSLAFGNITVFKDKGAVERYPDEAKEEEIPAKGSLSWDLVQYACTGAITVTDTVRVKGVLPTLAYGRKRLGFSD